MTLAGADTQSHSPRTVSARAPAASSKKTSILPRNTKNTSSTSCVCAALPWRGGTNITLSVKCSAGIALASVLPDAPVPMKRCCARRNPSTRASANACHVSVALLQHGRHAQYPRCRIHVEAREHSRRDGDVEHAGRHAKRDRAGDADEPGAGTEREDSSQPAIRRRVEDRRRRNEQKP